MLDKDKTIMVISTSCLEVPPENYGGLELIVYNLSKELGRRGYDITCVAPEGTEIEGVDIIETIEPDDSQNCFAREPEAYEVYAPYMPDCDVIIDHSWQKISYIGKQQNQEFMGDVPILGVWHGMPSVETPPPAENPCQLSVSNAASKAWQDFMGVEFRTAHNGIDFSRYPLEEDKDDYFLSLNRIMPEKGIKEAIQIAERQEVNLKVVGEDQFVDSPDYVSEVMGMCASSDYATYIGSVDHERKVDLIRKSKGIMLLPRPPYKEVFGLAAVEAMSCGTPVVAMDNNGLGEVVRTAQEWGVADSLEQAEQFVAQIDEEPEGTPGGQTLRESAKSHFSVSVMTDEYLKRAEEAMIEGW